MRAEPLRWMHSLQLRIRSAKLTNPHCKFADSYGIAWIADIVGVAVFSAFLDCDQAAGDVFCMAEAAYLVSPIEEGQRLSRQGVPEESRDHKSYPRALAFAERVKRPHHGQAEAKPRSQVTQEMLSRQLSEGILHPRSRLHRNGQFVVLSLNAGFAVDFRRRYIEDRRAIVRGELAGTQGKIGNLLSNIPTSRQNPQRSYWAS